MLKSTLFLALYCAIAEAAHAEQDLACEGRVKQCEHACDDGKAAACIDLGDYYLKSIPHADFKAARDAYDSACELDKAEGCAAFGAFLVDKRARAGAAQAVPVLKKSCKAGNFKSCDGAGQLLAIGNGVAPDREKAMKLLETACNGGFTPSCTRLGGLHCEDDEESKECLTLTLRSCESAAGCSDLVQAPPVAGAIWALHCEKGSLPACTKSADLYAGPLVGKPEASKVLNSACKNGVPRACANRALLMLRGASGFKKDEEKAVELLEKASDAQDHVAERALGVILLEGRIVDEDKARGKVLLTRACDGEDGPACGHLGWAMFNGKPLKKDKKGGVELLKKSCKLGHKEGCGFYQSASTQLDDDEDEEELHPKKKKKRAAEDDE